MPTGILSLTHSISDPWAEISGMLDYYATLSSLPEVFLVPMILLLSFSGIIFFLSGPNELRMESFSSRELKQPYPGCQRVFFSFGVIYKIPSHFEGKKNPLVTAVENLTSMIWNYEHSR